MTDVWTSKLDMNQSSNEKKFQRLNDMMKVKQVAQDKQSLKPPVDNTEISLIKKRLHLTEENLKDLNTKIRK